jgi:hypothetical protein
LAASLASKLETEGAAAGAGVAVELDDLIE